VSPLERLLAETIPTRPTPAIPSPRRVPAGHQWTPAEQAQHWADLCAAVNAPHEQRPHLRAVRAA
jgi:hypothetical protein